MIAALVREARPKQWVKNVLVFAGPGALGVLGEVGPLGRTATVFAAFCLVSSGVYFWNDIRDLEQDRTHPRKKFRPIAAGEIPLPVARVLGSVLTVGGPALAWSVRPEAGVILVLYAVIQLAYSVGLKHVPVLDLAIVSSGFVLRAMAGAIATQTPMSNWFVLCITFGSFFIVAGKRFAELLELGEGAVVTRRSLAEYSTVYLRQILVVSCTATAVTYCMWALESAASIDETVPLHGLTIVPMVLALLRYMLVLERGGGGAPEEVFFGDRSIQFYGLVWAVIYGFAVYAG